MFSPNICGIICNNLSGLKSYTFANLLIIPLSENCVFALKAVWKYAWAEVLSFSINTHDHSGTVTPVVSLLNVKVIVPSYWQLSSRFSLISLIAFLSSFNFFVPSSLPPAALITLKCLK